MSIYNPKLDLWKLRFDPEYLAGLKSDIMFRLWLKAEMRMAYDEELNRVVLYGDGSKL